MIRYEYDSWGKLLSVTDVNGDEVTNPTSFGHLNPFRYRGYYYDTESGLYYLQSRYYDPENGRFINADELISEPGGPSLGNNMFTYCFNNPVNMIDEDGQWPSWGEIGKALITAAVVTAVVVVAAAIIVGTGGIGGAVLAAGGSAAMAASATATAVTVGTAAAYTTGAMVIGAGVCAAGESIQYMASDGTPRDNRKQNKQTKAAAKKYNLSDYGRETLHDDVTGQGFNFKEIMATAKSIAQQGGKYIKHSTVIYYRPRTNSNLGINYNHGTSSNPTSYYSPGVAY